MLSVEKRLSKFTKFVFWFVVINSTAAALALTLFPTQTQTYFFWNITPPINAMLVGMMYLGASAAVAYAAIRGTWESARLMLVIGSTLSAALLVATLTHIDRFVPGVKLYYWLLVYSIFPVLAALMYWRYEKSGASWQVTQQAIKPSIRRGALIIAAAMLSAILVGLLFSDLVVSIWPWKLSGLMLGIFLSWLAALVASSLWIWVETEWTRVQPVAYMLIATPVVLAAIMLINRSDLTGNPLGLWGLSVGLAVIGMTGLVMLWQQRR